MQQVIEGLRAGFVGDRELKQVLADREVSFVTGFESLRARGEAMQTYNHYRGNPDGFGWELNTARKVTPEMLKALAARFLTSARAEIITMPGKP
jgi:hypothetical protein